MDMLSVADMTAGNDSFSKVPHASCCSKQRTKARQRLFAAAAQDAAVGAQHERDATNQDRARLSAILQGHLLIIFLPRTWIYSADSAQHTVGSKSQISSD